MEHNYRPISMELKYPGIKFKSAQRPSYVCVMAKGELEDNLTRLRKEHYQTISSEPLYNFACNSATEKRKYEATTSRGNGSIEGEGEYSVAVQYAGERTRRIKELGAISVKDLHNSAYQELHAMSATEKGELEDKLTGPMSAECEYSLAYPELQAMSVECLYSLAYPELQAMSAEYSYMFACNSVTEKGKETENQSSVSYKAKGKGKVVEGSRSEIEDGIEDVIEDGESSFIEKEGVKKTTRCCEEDCNHKQIRKEMKQMSATLKKLQNLVDKLVATNKGEEQPFKWHEWLAKAIMMAGSVLFLSFAGKKVGEKFDQARFEAGQKIDDALVRGGKKFDEAMHEMKAARNSWESAGCPSPIAFNPNIAFNPKFW